MGLLINLFIKFVFVLSIILHVMLWPSIANIIFASVLALEGILSYLTTSKEEMWSKVTSPSLFFFHGKQNNLKSYICYAAVGIYMIFAFLHFTNDEIDIQQHMTTWIDNTLVQNYSFTNYRNQPFANVDVTSEKAKKMRDNTFAWPKSWQDNAVRLVGNVSAAGPGKSTLTCWPDFVTNNPPAAAGSSSNESVALVIPNYACYATKLRVVTPPDNVLSSHNIVPMSSQFYSVDVMISPFAGGNCKDLEVYRITLDAQGNVEHGLDYPAASTIHDGPSQGDQQHCGLFGNPAWCLHFQHTFRHSDYLAQIAKKCNEADGNLVFRLPIRSLDIEPTNGLVGLDTLLVTKGARVQLLFRWLQPTPSSTFISAFQRPWETDDSSLEDWRASTDNITVFFKFFIMMIPLLLAWYYLGINFLDTVMHSQILLLSIFVLFPSTLLFLSLGAWLPMVGCIVCVVAVNHTPDPSVTWWRSMVRPTLFFITASCNSIQFVWLLALVGQAGWNSFLYENSLQQLSDLTSQFIISDKTASPTWIGLMLPSMLLINLAFLLGSALCIVLETLPRLKSNV